MPLTITLDTLNLDALMLTQDPNTGDIVGMATYTVSSSTTGFSRQVRHPMLFSPTQQTQIKNFIAAKIAELKTAEGI